MHIGITLRNMGAQSATPIMLAGAQLADEAGLESLWITDHVAIPPDDAEGSGGRYVDPLVTLAWLAGQTQRIRLGTGVLILPYRSALPTVRQVAAIQELSGERLLLGVGIGWMGAEFRALGIDRSARARDSDNVLALLRDCFSGDVVTRNGQPFLFKPRPTRPPVLVGGAAPHAWQRAIAYGDGWLPMTRSADAAFAKDVASYFAAAQAADVSASVSVMCGIALEDSGLARDQAIAFREIGVERLIVAVGYDTERQYAQRVEAVGRVRDALS